MTRLMLRARAGEGASVRARLPELDRFRGAAILLMMLDHVVLILDGPTSIRETVTRLAMPAFFVLAGALASGRLRWRHAGIAVLGIYLPMVVPWLDSPNVLLWWALGCCLLAGCYRFGVPVYLLALGALTLYANGVLTLPGAHTYQPWALIGLMAVGAMLRDWPVSPFAWAVRLPAWVGAIGRHPIAWYAGHALALQALALWVL